MKESMPTYIYRREDGSVFEKMQGINEAPLTKCPVTGQKATRVITGGAGIVFKGSGWYVTDYKNKNQSVETQSDKKSEAVATDPNTNGTTQETSIKKESPVSSTTTATKE